ncbi:hypothetical protein KW94_03795 [Clostridioides difficile]|nr:hypothetical protein KW94_03795 [Clostridioides difficile]
MLNNRDLLITNMLNTIVKESKFDYKLLLETENRMKSLKKSELISRNELMEELNVSEKDLENIEVDFE